MQDRFKFRVWCKTNQEWEKDEICITNKEHYIITNPKFTRVTNIDPQYHEINFCSGLKDKNGKLIYEGDIVKTSPSGFFDNDRDVFYIKFTDGYRLAYQDWQTLDTIGGFSNKLFEVIGNIYETPELLGEVSNDN